MKKYIGRFWILFFHLFLLVYFAMLADFVSRSILGYAMVLFMMLCGAFLAQLANQKWVILFGNGLSFFFRFTV